MVSECGSFALLQTSWIQCSCPCWILAVGSLRESWPLWQRSLLMSSKHTCSCHPRSTTGQARPLPSSTRWGESLLTCTSRPSVLIPLLKVQLCWGSCCLLKEVNKCQCFICSCSWTIQCQHFQDDEGGRAVVDQDYNVQCEMLVSGPNQLQNNCLHFRHQKRNKCPGLYPRNGIEKYSKPTFPFLLSEGQTLAGSLFFPYWTLFLSRNLFICVCIFMYFFFLKSECFFTSVLRNLSFYRIAKRLL